MVIVNKHPGYTEISRNTAMVKLTDTVGTHNLKEHCNGIVNKLAGYTESQGALQWYT